MGGKCCWRHFRVYSCRDTLKFAGAAEAVNRFFSSPRCVLRKSVACLRIQLPISSSLVLLLIALFSAQALGAPQFCEGSRIRYRADLRRRSR